MDDELMKCAVCGTTRASRYAAYCHVCGSALPELPPEADEPAGPPQTPRGWEDPAGAEAVFGAGAGTAAGAGSVSPDRGPEESYPTGSDPAGSYPTRLYPPGSRPRGADSSGTPRASTPAQPAQGGVRVYERPETPPSVVRRRRLTWILAGIGVLISLLLLALGPLRTVLGARSEPGWTPPGTATPVHVIAPTRPPGVSAAQATARARFTATPSPTVAPTWTEGVDPGTPANGGPGGALATPVLPTLAPAPTAALAPAAAPPAPTVAPLPSATEPGASEPTAPPATILPPETPTTAPATVQSGAGLPQAISGGRVLAFVSDRSGSPQIWLTDAAGGNQIQVTRQGQNASPSWSYDDRYLYYIGQRDGQTSVYRLDITTGREEQVLQDPSVVSARPLPNGQMAILRTETGSYALYVNDRRLFQLDRPFQYQFSPEGGRVVIDPNADPRVISVVDVGTTSAQEVAPARSWNAGWGQGDRLTYASDRTGIASIYLAGPNGEEAKVVSPADKWSQAPAFSSDGSQIAFIGGDGSAWNVYVVGADGQNPHKVGGPANPSKAPVWQPGGSLLAYESNRAGNWDIFVADPSGNERALTSDPGNDVDPAWTW